MAAGYMSFSMDELRVVKSALLAYMTDIERASSINRLERPEVSGTYDKLWRTARGMYETLDFVLHDVDDEEYIVEHHGQVDNTIVGGTNG